MAKRKQPEKPQDLAARVRGAARKSILLRLSPELHDELRRWAAQDMRSLNAHVEYLLRDSVKKRRGR